MSVKTQINIDLDLTASVCTGILIVLTGIVSLFTLKDAGFATTTITVGAGLVAAAKIANTIYDNAHDVKNG